MFENRPVDIKFSSLYPTGSRPFLKELIDLALFHFESLHNIRTKIYCFCYVTLALNSWIHLVQRPFSVTFFDWMRGQMLVSGDGACASPVSHGMFEGCVPEIQSVRAPFVWPGKADSRWYDVPGTTETCSWQLSSEEYSCHLNLSGFSLVFKNVNYCNFFNFCNTWLSFSVLLWQWCGQTIWQVSGLLCF